MVISIYSQAAYIHSAAQTGAVVAVEDLDRISGSFQFMKKRREPGYLHSLLGLTPAVTGEKQGVTLW